MEEKRNNGNRRISIFSEERVQTLCPMWKRSITTIYSTIKEKEKTNLNLPDFKELIFHLTGWDIPFQVISRQLEINKIVW